MRDRISGIRNHFCCKILPLVYDDSLSYYEMLCKLTKKINEIIDFIGGVWSKELLKMLYKKLNDLYADVSYDEPNERLKLHLGAKIFADGEHIYSSDNSSMEITGGGENNGECSG